MENNENVAQVVPTQGFIFGEQLYQKLKFVVGVLLPALGTLYYALGSLWELPHVEQVLGSTSAIAIFLGALVGISTRNYNAGEGKYFGTINASTNDVGTKVYSIELKGDPSELADHKEVIFKIGSRS